MEDNAHKLMQLLLDSNQNRQSPQSPHSPQNPQSSNQNLAHPFSQNLFPVSNSSDNILPRNVSQPEYSTSPNQYSLNPNLNQDGLKKLLDSSSSKPSQDVDDDDESENFGTNLQGKNVVYSLENKKLEDKKHLKSTNIVQNRAPNVIEKTQGKLIIASPNSISYALANGKVRLFQQLDGTKTVLKNAEKQIADMSFFQSAVSGIENTELLGTVSINGTIVIRKIFQQEKMINEEILLRVDPPENLISKDYRMIWSPLDQDLVVITGGPNNKNIYLVSISQVIEHNQNETTLTLDQFYQSPGVTCLEWHKLKITDICFSIDGTCLVSSSSDGSVAIWNVESKELVREFIPFNHEEVSLVQFRSDLSKGGIFSSNFCPVLITGSKNNTIFKIWNAVTWMCLQTLELDFKQPINERLNVCSTNDLPFLFVAHKSLLSIHLNLPNITTSSYTQVEACKNLKEPFFDDDSIGFDFIREFLFKEDFLSVDVMKAYVNFDGMEFYCISQKEVLRYDVSTTTCYPGSRSTLPTIYDDSEAKLDLEPDIEKEKALINFEDIENEPTVQSSQQESLVEEHQTSEREPQNETSTPKEEQQTSIQNINETTKTENVEKEDIETSSMENTKIFENDAKKDKKKERVKKKNFEVGEKSPKDQKEPKTKRPVEVGELLKFDDPTSSQSFQSGEVHNKNIQNLEMLTPETHLPPQIDKKIFENHENLSNDDQLKKILELVTSQYQELPQLLEKVVQKELKNVSNPSIAKLMTPVITKSINDSLKDALPKTITPTVDRTVKETMTKFFTKEKIAEQVSKTVVTTIQPLIQESFKVAFENTLIPSFNLSCQNLFQQLHSTFQQGIESAFQNLGHETNNEALEIKKTREKLNEMLVNFETSLQQTQQNIAQQHTAQIQQIFGTLSKNLQQTLESNLQKALINVSHSQPSDTEKEKNLTTTLEATKNQIAQYIKAGNSIDAMFLALSCSNVDIVIDTCSKLDIGKFFENPTPEPSLVLSLVQQLTVGVEKNLDLLLPWISEGILSLGHSDLHEFADHIPTVINRLITTLTPLMQTFPASAKSIKMTIQMSKSLLTV